MRAYLVQVLRETRQAGEHTLRDLEVATGRERSNLSRLETGVYGQALAQIDEIVAGYAKVAGIRPQDLWRRALEQWDQAEALGIDATRQKGRAAAQARSSR